MKLIAYPTMICALFLVSGCDRPPPVELPPQGPLFCEIEEPRRFTQEELDWRSTYAPWNLRRDWNTNKTFDDECVT